MICRTGIRVAYPAWLFSQHQHVQHIRQIKGPAAFRNYECVVDYINILLAYLFHSVFMYAAYVQANTIVISL